MYLSTKKITCPIVQISMYLSVLKQFTFFKTVWNLLKPDINSLVNIVDPDQLASEEASWSGIQDPHCFQCNMYTHNNKSKYEIQNFINFIHLYLSNDKAIEIFNLSWMKWEQVGQVGHGISTALKFMFYTHLR